ncbi:MAG: CHAT domain-containing protein, partial [Desulfobacterales bacterium]|nr:CHAT domain-containing protein [Desulfobacterales bacterium]
PGAGDHKRADGIQSRLAGWGKALFDAVFGTVEGVNAYRNLMDREKEGFRCLVTLGAEDPRVLGQPWEMMRDERGPLAFRGVTIRRQLKGAKIVRTSALELPLRALLIVSRPSDIGFIDPRNSIPPILDALESLPAGMAEVSFCDPPTLKGLEKMISEARKAKRPFHIVHFDGHGTYLPKTGVGALAFERENAKTHLVSGIDLGDLLTRLDIPLALLEACRGSDLSDRPVFGSVAPALLQAGVGSVVAFSHSVHIKAARILVERFYAELAAGMTVGQALEESRSALHADRTRWLRPGPDAETIDLQDWFIPQLYQVGPDPALITDGRTESGPARPRGARRIRKRMHGEFPPRPMYQFHGRALELLKLEASFISRFTLWVNACEKNH